MNPADDVLASFMNAFDAQKALADKAIAQVPDDLLRRALDENTNSIAVIMKHLGGNLSSRFTDFLNSDGEKPWRDRDAEFVDTFRDRSEILSAWEAGWQRLFETLADLRTEQLNWSVNIRGEPHSVAEALARSLAHAGYHVGQIMLIARLQCKDHWKVITVPRGGTQAHNRKLGYNPAPIHDADDANQ